MPSNASQRALTETQSAFEQVYNHKHQGFMGLWWGLLIMLGTVSQMQRSKLCSHVCEDQWEEATPLHPSAAQREWANLVIFPPILLTGVLYFCSVPFWLKQAAAQPAALSPTRSQQKKQKTQTSSFQSAETNEAWSFLAQCPVVLGLLITFYEHCSASSVFVRCWRLQAEDEPCLSRLPVPKRMSISWHSFHSWGVCNVLTWVASLLSTTGWAHSAALFSVEDLIICL